jgi:hypothetical protein
MLTQLRRCVEHVVGDHKFPGLVLGRNFVTGAGAGHVTAAASVQIAAVAHLEGAGHTSTHRRAYRRTIGLARNPGVAANRAGVARQHTSLVHTGASRYCAAIRHTQR